MRYLLDTVVVSEAARPAPDPGLLDWLAERSALELCISALTLGEIRKGVLLLPRSRKRTRLEEWLRTSLVRQFSGRVLAVDEAVALAWGRLAAEARLAGRELPVIDGLLLATADVHSLTLVTRNERDCRDRGVPILNPWSA
jgi:predicted nucleic acid-binding protein